MLIWVLNMHSKLLKIVSNYKTVSIFQKIFYIFFRWYYMNAPIVTAGTGINFGLIEILSGGNYTTMPASEKASYF